ncbi:glycosyltransferase [bacterium]|nr:glycosyltransferase [bacterium]MCG2676283.1 glycosyltransferase [bacterium]
MAHPKISIIIPTKEFDEDLKECLDYCLKLDYPDYEIIVLPDRPKKIFYSRTKIVSTGEKGPAEKRDIGIKHAQGSILAFLDADAFPTKNWLKNAVKYFADREIGAIGGPAITPPTDNFRQKAGGLILSSLFISGALVYRYIPCRKREVDDYPTCNLLVRKEVMNRTGGFSTKFWPGEDTELCLRITRDLKKEILYVPDVQVYHHRRPLLKPHLQQVTHYALHRGYFVKKFPQTSLRLVYFLPAIFLLAVFFGWLLIFLHPLLITIYLAFVLVYLSFYLFHALKISKGFRKGWLVFLGSVASHLFYGAFFLKGLFSRRLKEE